VRQHWGLTESQLPEGNLSYLCCDGFRWFSMHLLKLTSCKSYYKQLFYHCIVIGSRLTFIKMINIWKLPSLSICKFQWPVHHSASPLLKYENQESIQLDSEITSSSTVWVQKQFLIVFLGKQSPKCHWECVQNDSWRGVQCKVYHIQSFKQFIWCNGDFRCSIMQLPRSHRHFLPILVILKLLL